MEQAINQFTKGLLMDTNPMMQENTTLSDALNATITTLNGNELILQNDMGNRRVDHAYLPSGYEPVGIKEYGGVIYIACYNPITNKGQVGSFPSPERRMEIPDIGTTAIKLDTLFDVDEKHDLKSDTVLLPLTSGQVLHAGDKFVIYDNDITDYKDEISNYENIQPVGSGKDSLVLSPKNRTYTLSVGVLNSQNEFMDITKSLCRWQDDGTGKFKIIKYNKQSELYKFNDGYFIPGNYTPEGLTGDDANLVKARQTIEANTYSYKLVGPLYLKVHLNHFQDFNYNMYADKDGDNYINLYIESTIVYNCPDYAKTYKSEGSDKYRTLGLIREPLNDKWFDFTLTPIPKNALDDWTEKDINPNIDINTFKSADKLYIGNSTIPQSAPDQATIDTNPYDVNPGREQEVDIDDEVDTDIEYNYESSYDEDNDLYTLKFVQKYKHFLSSNVKKLHYTIRPYVLWKNHTTNNDNKGYLKDLMAEGNIDTSKLGTNVADITEWRFFNYTDSTRLIYSFEAYPKFGTKFETLDLEFYKCSENGVSEDVAFAIEGLEFRNGRSTVNFNWGEYNIKPRELYLVKIKVAGADDIVERWFLSTELMNDCFNTSKDFGDKDDADVKDKLTIKLTVDYNKDTNVQYGSVSNELDSNYNHSLINSNDRGIKLSYDHIGNINFVIKNLRIVNQDLYPDFISVTSSDIQQANISYNIDPLDINFNKSENLSPEYNLENFDNWVNVQTENSGHNSYKVQVSYKDIFQGSVVHRGVINYPFKLMDQCISKAIYGGVGEHCHGGIAIGWHPRDGKGDYHTILIVGPHTMPSFRIDGLSDDIDTMLKEYEATECTEVKSLEIANEHHDGTQKYKISDFVYAINDNFNMKFGNNTFVYYFNNVRDNTDNNVYNGCSDSCVTHECNAIAKIQNRPSKWHESGWKNYVYDAINESQALKENRLPFKNYARLWWKTVNGNWALVDSPICRSGNLNAKEGSDDPGSNGLELVKFIRRRPFNNKDIYYCYTNSEDISENHIFKANNMNYMYNDIYQVKINTIISINFNDTNIKGASSTGETLFSYNNSTTVQIEESDIFKSSDSFPDVVNNVISSDIINNVALISNGEPIFFDDNNQTLDQQSFYSYENGQLHKENFPYKITEGFNGFNTILYNENIGTSGKLEFRYDVGGGNNDDNWTVIDYDSGIPIVKTYK